MLLQSFVIALLSIGLCTADVYVSPSGTDDSTCGGESTPCLTIAGGIAQASLVDHIILMEGTYNGTNNTNIDFTSSKELTFYANNDTDVVVDCLSDGYFMTVLHDSNEIETSFEGFRIQNCKSPSGALYFALKGGPASVTKMEFFNNVDAVRTSTSSVLEIGECTFVGNSRAIYVDTGSLSVAYSIFANNSHPNGGGAIYIAPENPESVIFHSSFTGNEATNGGAISVVSLCRVDTCGFERNSASDNGGVFHVQNTRLTVVNSTMTNNVGLFGAVARVHSPGTGAIFTNCEFIDNVSPGDAGVIFNNIRTSLEITNSVIKGNRAGRNGGAFRSISSTLTISGTDITDNRAGSGGAFYVERSSSVHLIGGTLQGNQANGEGNAIYCTDSEVTMEGTSLAEGDFYCASFPQFTRCATDGDNKWVDFCPALPDSDDNSEEVDLLIGVIVGIVGVLLITVIVIGAIMYMKKHRYWLWAEVAEADEELEEKPKSGSSSEEE